MSDTPGSAEPQLRNNNEWRSRGYLPHRDRIGLLQSITFRLADSLPQEKLRELEMELEEMKMKEEEAELGLRVPRLRVPGEVERRKRIEEWLDAGMGCCALRHPQMAEVMQDTLLSFDEEKYLLIAWCIMPNHVHVLIEPRLSLSTIVRSWKSYTGRWAMRHNVELGLGIPVEKDAGEKGAEEKRDVGKKDAELGLRDPRVHASRVWMPDYWDRYIRDEIHLRSVIDYIHNNPVKAGLCRKETDWPWSSTYADNNKMYE
ncbi:MAG: transposase [Chlorobi bacterium]|nr:transposase [Chlorobiota bacterium]